MEMKTHKIRDTIFLFLTAMIWGAAFVAQSVSMDYIGPFTFICLRSVIGGLFLIPVIMVIDNIRKKRRSESVKTASFYIIIVPVVGLFFKKYCGILTWIGVVIALAGLYFLCITEKMTIQRGDALILCCSFLYTGQILAIDHYNPFVDGVKMSCIQFLTGGMLGAICMFLFESPNMAMILNAAGPILYTGIMLEKLVMK